MKILKNNRLIGWYPPFYRAWKKLSPVDKWTIELQINHMRFAKSITEYANSINCPHLKVANHDKYFILDIGKDGLGKYRAKLVVYEDIEFNIIWPIDCYYYS